MSKKNDVPDTYKKLSDTELYRSAKEIVEKYMTETYKVNQGDKTDVCQCHSLDPSREMIRRILDDGILGGIALNPSMLQDEKQFEQFCLDALRCGIRAMEVMKALYDGTEDVKDTLCPERSAVKLLGG